MNRDGCEPFQDASKASEGGAANKNPPLLCDMTPSRRTFLGGAATAALAMGVSQEAHAAPATCRVDPSHPIKKQDMFVTSLQAPTSVPGDGAGPLTGAEIFARLCVKEKLSALFMAPGNYAITHEIAQAGIPSYGGRGEGSMCGAADGYSRSSGEVAACSGTEGPGFTNMIMWIATAHFANTPLLVLASNKSLAAEDSQKGIQWMNQQRLTEGLRKYGKRITDPGRIHEYGANAFRSLKTGIPGIAHLDFPTEVAAQKHEDPERLIARLDPAHYRTDTRAAPDEVAMVKLVEMIASAERPVIVAGVGVIYHKAWESLLRAAVKNQIPLASAGPIRGAVPDDHPLSANMATEAFKEADLVIIVGQYLMPPEDEWSFKAGVPTVRVHPEAGDLGRNWQLELGIVSDEALFAEELADRLPIRSRDSWLSVIRAATTKRQDFLSSVYRTGLGYSEKTGTLHPAVIGQELHNFLYKGKIDPKQTVTGFDGALIGSYVSQYLRAFRPAQELLPMYQFGAMGPAMAMMMGASAAVQRGVGHQASHAGAPVFVVTGDGCASYSLFELDTAIKYGLPVICLVYNNNAWSTFVGAASTPRAAHLHLFQENLRYDQIAEALGARGAYVHTPEQLRSALQVAYDEAVRNKTSTVINCQGHRDFGVRSQYPGGLPPFPPEPGLGGFVH